MASLGVMTLGVALLTACALTPLVIWTAKRLGLLDRPGPRKIHRAPVPRVGGVPVFFGFVAGLVYAAYATGNLLSPATVTVYWSVLAAGAFAMFVLGLLDDLVGLSFQWKFAVQITAAVAAWGGGFRVEVLSHPLGGAPLDLGLWSLPVTVVWIVGITNAINLLDGLDGLAAGTALITTSAVAVIAFHGGHTGVTAASVALVGSLLGFLPFNFNPARVFLGDSGSMLLGFVLAVISIRGSQKGATAVAVLAPLLMLGLPILDTGLAILRRLWRLGKGGDAAGGRVAFLLRNLHRLFLPDQAHLHHRLLDLGMSHRAVVLVLYAGVLLLALAALADVVMNSIVLAVGLLAGLAILTLSLSVYLRLTAGRRESGVGGSVEGEERPAATAVAPVRRAQSS